MNTKESSDRSSDDDLDWLASKHDGFGQITQSAEFRNLGETSDHYSVNETWWFEASVPERGLSASFYISMRPNLGICSAGSWMWSGHKNPQILADHLNFQLYLPEPRFSGSTISVPEVGLEFEIVKPFELIYIRYNPPGMDVSAELTVRGHFHPVMRSNEKHFEQATWTKGWIEIDGDRIQVDGPSFRDRSWGEPRGEQHLAHPPIGWLYGVVGNGEAAFNLSGGDDPSGDVVWSGAYPQTREDLFFDGWVMRKNKLKKIVSMSKHTERDPLNRLAPKKILVDFMDDDGDQHRLEGIVRTSFNMHFWPNLNSWFGLTDWRLDDLSGYGGCQDYAWPDYCKRFWK